MKNFLVGDDVFETILDALPSPIFVVDTNVRMHGYNSAATTLFDSEPEKILRMGCGDALSCIYSKDTPQGCGGGEACKKCVIRNSVNKTFGGDKIIREKCEMQLVRRKNIEKVQMLVTTAPLKYEDELYALVTLENITEFEKVELERKEALNALNESEERYHILYDSIREAVLVADTNRRIVHCNPAFMELFGYTLDEIIGKPTRCIYETEYESRKIGDQLRESFGGPGFLIATQFIKKSGQIFPGEESVHFVKNSQGKVVGLIGSIRDITERRLKEQALENRIIALTRPFDQNDKISFKELFDLKAIQVIQDQFAAATGVASIITNPDGTPITSPSNFCRLCRDIIRQTELGRKNCFHSDAVIGHSNQDGPIVQTCLSGGLWDAGASIILGGHHIANWLIGQVRNDTQTEEKMKEYAQEIGADQSEFITAFREVPSMSRERFERIADVLFTFANQLSTTAYQNILQARFIAELKQAKTALGESEARLSQIVMGSPVPTFVIDNNHVTTHWNKALEKVTGISGSNVIGTNKQWMAFYSKERPVMVDLIVDDVSENEISKYYIGKYRKAAGIENAYEAEDFFPDMGNTGKWLFFTAAPLRSSEGTTIGAVETLQDTTSRKKAEQALKESEEKYRLLIEFANDAIFIAQDDSIKFPNPKGLDLVGYSEEELGKMPFANLIHPDDRNLVLERYKRILKGEELPRTHSFRVIHKTGKQLNVQISAAPIIWEGRPATLNLLRDVTSQKMIEDQLRHTQKLEAIGTLAGGIAHDFNNILSAILGYSELALADLPPEASLCYKLEAIHSSGERARDLVTQILAFSRKDEQAWLPVAMHLIVKDALKLLRPAIPTTIDIKTQITSKCHILGDPSRLHRIIMNLCTNAYQAMLETGGTLNISLSQEKLENEAVSIAQVPSGSYAKLIISDTGVGIPPENLERIFDPYFTTKEKDKGTGLGLATVHGIVKNHRGAINVESQIGKGTRFEVYLPLTLAKSDMEKQTVSQLVGGNERILLIDDELVILKLEEEMLKRLGYIITSKDSATEALKLFSRHPEQFDLVITDMTMPNMTGEKLAGELRKIRSDIPVILCTGFSELMSKEKAKSLGINGFLMKPVAMKDLSKKIRDLLGEG